MKTKEKTMYSGVIHDSHNNAVLKLGDTTNRKSIMRSISRYRPGKEIIIHFVPGKPYRDYVLHNGPLGRHTGNSFAFTVTIRNRYKNSSAKRHFDVRHIRYNKKDNNTGKEQYYICEKHSNGSITHLSYNDPDIKIINKQFLNSVIHAYEHGITRPENKNLKRWQTKCIKKIITNIKNNGWQFLINVLPRAGKTFCMLMLLIETIKKFKYKNFLFITVKPGDVLGSLQDEINKEVKFKTLNVIEIDRKNIKNIQTSIPEDKKANFYTVTGQFALQHKKELIKLSKKVGGFDIIISDEAHYGITTYNMQNLYAKLSYSYDLRLSGTPYEEIVTCMFGTKEMFSFGIIDVELDKKQYGQNSDFYYFPKMLIHQINFDKEVFANKKLYSQNDLFSWDKFYSEENRALMIESFKKLLLFQDPRIYKSIINNNIIAGSRAIMLYVPDIKSARAIVEMINDEDGAFVKRYHAELIADDNDKKGDSHRIVKDAIYECKLNPTQKPIFVTCGKLTHSISIPELDTVIFMCNWSSAELLWQAAMRCMTPDPDNRKEYGNVVFVGPDAKLKINVMLYNMIQAHSIATGKTEIEATKIINDCQPILAYDNNQIQNIDYDGVLKWGVKADKNIRFTNASINTTKNKISVSDAKKIMKMPDLGKVSSHNYEEQITKNDLTGKSNKYKNAKLKSDKHANPYKNIDEKRAPYLNLVPYVQYIAKAKYQKTIENIDDVLNINSTIIKLVFGDDVTIDQIKLILKDSLCETALKSLNHETKKMSVIINDIINNNNDLDLFDVLPDRSNLVIKTPSKFVEEICMPLIPKIKNGYNIIDCSLKCGEFATFISNNINKKCNHVVICVDSKLEKEILLLMHGEKFRRFAKNVDIITKDNYMSYLNFLKENNMKFHNEVGNPPFQSPTNKANKEWEKILFLMLDVLETNGMLSVILPTTILNSHLASMAKARHKLTAYTINSIDLSIDHYFNVGQTVFALQLTNKKPEKNSQTKITFQNGTTGFIVFNGDPIPLNTNHIIEHSIVKKITSGNKMRFMNDVAITSKVAQEQKLYSTTKNSKHKYKVYHTASQIFYCNKDINKNYSTIKLGLNFSGTFFDKNNIDKYMPIGNFISGKNFRHIEFKSIDDAKIARENISKKVFIALMQFEKTSGFNTALHCFPKIDLSKTWTDKELYEYFKLTQEEIDYIETNVK